MSTENNVVDGTTMFGALRTAATELANRSRFARWVGKTFGGSRDVYEALGYKDLLTVADYRHRYERGGIAGTVVDVKPEATWFGHVDLVENTDPKITTRFEAAWRELDTRLSLTATFMHADILAGIGRYSVIFLGAPGALNTPLTSLRPDALAYVTCFAEDEARIDHADLETNSMDPRFGQPKFYTIPTLSPTQVNLKVHYSRIIHIRAEGTPSGILYGPPRLRRPWNYFDDLDKIVGGGAESYWVRANQGYVFNLDKEAKLDEQGKKDMRDQMDEFIHGMRRILRTQGVETKILGSDVAEINSSADTLLALISATTRIPQRILMGSERGQLASGQDRENWADTITNRQTQYAEPFVIRPFVNHLVALKTLPTPTEYHAQWPEQQTQSESDKADLTVKLTKANQQQGEDIMTTNEIRDRIYGLDPTENDPAQRRNNPAPPTVELDAAASAQPPTIELHPHVTVSPPNLTVAVPAPNVTVHMPPTPPEPKALSKKIEYDAQGRIASITPVEVAQ